MVIDGLRVGFCFNLAHQIVKDSVVRRIWMASLLLMTFSCSNRTLVDSWCEEYPDRMHYTDDGTQEHITVREWSDGELTRSNPSLGLCPEDILLHQEYLDG